MSPRVSFLTLSEFASDGASLADSEEVSPNVKGVVGDNFWETVNEARITSLC